MHMRGCAQPGQLQRKQHANQASARIVVRGVGSNLPRIQKNPTSGSEDGSTGIQGQLENAHAWPLSWHNNVGFREGSVLSRNFILQESILIPPSPLTLLCMRSQLKSSLPKIFKLLINPFASGKLRPFFSVPLHPSSKPLPPQSFRG
ncbi:hypothetical protein TcWFU_008198 [Taenia crassiceps]|uniref:Uncharacterized protein n=1 Tax=Taenia crassiceps TaxID=6207 RepID=A0ABR4QE49_9CEST